MSFLTRFAHEIVNFAASMEHRRFQNALSAPEDVQRKKLAELLGAAERTRFGQENRLSSGMSYESFTGRLPVTEYSDWETLIEEQKSSGAPVISTNCERYQPTSGSTSRVKWIPYSKRCLSEFDKTVCAWFYDLARMNKGFLSGRHYWSLSWLPNDLRSQISNTSDVELFPWWKRFLFSQTMAVPGSISLAPTSASATTASLAYLAACDDLAFMSVWSPTFALNILSDIATRRLEIASILERGEWGRWQDELSYVQCPRNPKAAALLRSWDGAESAFFRRLWPKLVLISAWDTASSKTFADELRRKLNVPVQGKGLWATEAVVTFPYRNSYPVALTSHFYEFKCLQTEKILPLWGLREGQVVQPIVSTGGGLWRYALRDRLKVTGFAGRTPSLEFLGRLDGCDLVGEKLSPELADQVLQRMNHETGLQWVSLIAVPASTKGVKRPFYLLLGQARVANSATIGLQEKAESLLCELFHYRLARELNQLDPCRIFVSQDVQRSYQEMMLGDLGILGNLKIESVALLRSSQLEPFGGL